MGRTIALTADDGHRLAAYRADPTTGRHGAIVVIQEIFGVNPHIRRVCDRFAEDGYVAIAPALFDRVEAGIELDYDEAGVARGRDVRAAVSTDDALRDIAAAVAAVAGTGKVGVVGYCWGGTLAWLAASRTAGVAAIVGYYGGQIAQSVDATPRIPVLLHFGTNDPHITAADISAIHSHHPGIPLHLYPAGHGFNCDARADFDRDSADLALQRTLAFFKEHGV